MSNKRNNYAWPLVVCFLFIWPFVTTIVALFSSLSVATKRFVTVVFSAIIGYNIYCFDVSGDSAHYVEHFMDYLRYGLNISEIFSSGRIDVFTTLSYAVVGLFTENPHFLFAFWGALYGLMMFEALRFISKYKFAAGPSFILLSILYVLNGHGNLGPIRFCFALWCFFYCFIRYTDNYEVKWLIALFLTPLIHTTFLLPCAVAIVFRYSKLNDNLLIVLLIVAFVAGRLLPVGEYLGALDYLSENENYSKYVSDRYISDWSDAANRKSFIHQFLIELPPFCCLGILLYLQPIMKKFEKVKFKTFHLYKFVLIMFSFSSFFVKVPNMGRFQTLSYMILVYLLIQVFANKMIKYNILYAISLCIIFANYVYMTYYDLSNRFEHNFLYPIFYLDISSR